MDVMTKLKPSAMTIMRKHLGLALKGQMNCCDDYGNIRPGMKDVYFKFGDEAKFYRQGIIDLEKLRADETATIKGE